METSTAGFEVVKTAKSQPYNPAVVIISAFPDLAADWKSYGADAMFHTQNTTKPLLALFTLRTPVGYPCGRGAGQQEDCREDPHQVTSFPSLNLEYRDYGPHTKHILYVFPTVVRGKLPAAQLVDPRVAADHGVVV
jgi:hypothetical protein